MSHFQTLGLFATSSSEKSKKVASEERGGRKHVAPILLAPLALTMLTILPDDFLVT